MPAKVWRTLNVTLMQPPQTESWLKKLMKLRQVSLFLADFSFLEPLCVSRCVFDEKIIDAFYQMNIRFAPSNIDLCWIWPLGHNGLFTETSNEFIRCFHEFFPWISSIFKVKKKHNKKYSLKKIVDYEFEIGETFWWIKPRVPITPQIFVTASTVDQNWP